MVDAKAHVNNQSPESKKDAKTSRKNTSPIHNSNPLDSLSAGVSSNCTSVDAFNPASENYNPISDACWTSGTNVPYIAFAKTLERIESTSSRLKIISVLSNFFRSVGILSPHELAMCINMSINRLGPSYEGLELGIGESILMKALAMTTGASNDRIKAEFLRLGDLGAVAEAVRSRQQTMFKPKPLTVFQVFGKLKEIANMSGHSAQTKKVKLIQSLLVACRECEAKYLIRSLQGKLRIGLAEQSVLAALGQAVATSPFHSIRSVLSSAAGALSPDLLDASKTCSSDAWKARLDTVVERVKQAYCQCPNYERIVESLLEDGPDTVHLRCCITPGVPLKPMLAHPTHGITEVLKRFDQSTFTCEYKYDGERAQIHLLPDASVHIYSRNQEDNTSKYPDISKSLMVSVLRGAKVNETACQLLRELGADASLDASVSSCILDSEAVAWDREAGQILPFQVLSTRKRKDVQEEDVKVRVCIYAFDLLYLNGVPLTEQPFRRRRELLQ
uniref:DNA ligase n=2 Tax=Schistocephalus solidus TaxID=70667 RepID=A0A0V0J9S6_SCHSO